MAKNRELIILVGMQGSGKTRYCKKYLHNYERISQDEGPRNYSGVVQRLHELLIEGKSGIVIDRTNPMRKQRRRFINMAKDAGYFVKIIYFDVPEDICKERIRNRENHPTLAADRMEKAIAQYLSRLDVPSSEECDELTVVGTDPGTSSKPVN